jgi:hypothetical protein
LSISASERYWQEDKKKHEILQNETYLKQERKKGERRINNYTVDPVLGGLEVIGSSVRLVSRRR